MGARPAWRRPTLAAGDPLPLLELVASESPQLLRYTVESLASSPARVALLKLVRDLSLTGGPEELISSLERAADQLDRLERGSRRSFKFFDVQKQLSEAALSARVVSAIAEARAVRWRHQGRDRGPQLVRLNRILREAANREGAVSLIAEYTGTKPENPGTGRPRDAATLVRSLVDGEPL